MAANPRPCRRAARVLFVVVLASLTALVLSYFVLHGPVTAGRLASSVARHTGSAGLWFDDEPRCERRGASRWRCTELDSGASGSASYDVTMRGDSSCWDAHLVHPVGEPMPSDAENCVRVLEW